jgi:hypothetical protein
MIPTDEIHKTKVDIRELTIDQIPHVVLECPMAQCGEQEIVPVRKKTINNVRMKKNLEHIERQRDILDQRLPSSPAPGNRRNRLCTGSRFENNVVLASVLRGIKKSTKKSVRKEKNIIQVSGELKKFTETVRFETSSKPDICLPRLFSTLGGRGISLDV